MASTKKRRTILDYFNRNHQNTIAETNKTNSENKIPNIIENNTNCDEINNDECDESVKINNDLDFIDVNYFNPNILQVNFYEDDKIDNLNNYLNNVINIDKNDDNYEANYVFVYKKFRSIIKDIVSDSHYAYLFDETDWEQIQEFTSLKGCILVSNLNNLYIFFLIFRMYSVFIF